MQFKDTNGVSLKDGDYILTTGDGLGAFSMKHWTVGIFRQQEEDGFYVEPLVSPTDGRYTVRLPALEYGSYKIDEATAWAMKIRRKKPSASTVWHSTITARAAMTVVQTFGLTPPERGQAKIRSHTCTRQFSQKNLQKITSCLGACSFRFLSAKGEVGRNSRPDI
jgi:hypothetical protein